VLIDESIGAALNRNLGSPVAPWESVEAELDRLIERRSRQKDPDEESELWQESVRRYKARRREEMRAAWCEHHQEQAARLRTVLEGLASRHEELADRYRDQPEAEGARTYGVEQSELISRLDTFATKKRKA
jgi:hypothetical protein